KMYRSTNNTRIERLWVEVGSQFARRWRAFFYRLEALHGLDRTNPHHLWLLHLLFLDLINLDCENFRAEWNCHPISGEGHDQSPEAGFDLLYLRGYLQCHRICGADLGVIEHHYGTFGPPLQREPGQTGAGQLEDEDIPLPPNDFDDEEDEEEDDLAAQIEEAQTGHFHHEPVPVPKHANPFDDDESTGLFYDALEEAINRELIPPGYGLLPEEWGEEGYPTFEILKSGRRGGRQLRVALPDAIWRPRAEMWGRALAILNQITYVNEP
ncbi:hypothetical protein C8F04DRAFT_969811, partial [Mycena alexandri]